jgi:predicted nucleic acid-binding protein
MTSTGRVLADSSAWVEFLRGTGSAPNLRIRELLGEPERLVLTGPVLAEVLAGSMKPHEPRRIRDLLSRCSYVPVEDPFDFHRAAAIHRACRMAGSALRGHSDSLIAAVAMRAEAAVLHLDRDFDVIAEHAPLALA